MGAPNHLIVWRADVSGEKFWLIARDEHDASLVMDEYSLSEYRDDVSLTPLPSDSQLTVNDEDDGKITKTCAEWALLEGRGYLCGTVW